MLRGIAQPLEPAAVEARSAHDHGELPQARHRRGGDDAA
jgi:hypothetical protein